MYVNGRWELDRPKGEKIMLSGHLQEKGGKYYAVLNCKHQNGKRFPKWVSTDLPAKKGYKRLAENKLEEFKNIYSIHGELLTDSTDTLKDESISEAMENTEYIEPAAAEEQGVLFADYMLSWLSDMETEVDPSTFAGYCHCVENIIVPYFRQTGVKLHDLTSRDIKDFYKYERKGDTEANKKSKKGSTVVHYHINIHKALEDAVENQLVLRNVAHKQRPATERFVGNFYLADEAMELIKAAEGTKLELAVIFGLFYGLRRSEIVGLKWQNFDLVNDIFTISHTVTTFKYKGKTVFHAKDKTKNQSSMRSLPLVPFVKEKLLALKEQQKEDRLVFGECYITKYQAYVYVNEIGERIKPDYISGQFPKLLKKSGLRRIRFHDTRHSCASLLLKNGVSMKEIQAWLGHSDYGTTANLYAHLDVETSKIHSAQRLSTGLFGVSEKNGNINAASP
jgi:integrase